MALFGNPLLVFLIGVIAVVLLLVWLDLPAFVGLILATFVVGLVTPEVPIAEIPATTAENFGTVMTSIGIPILMAAIIGKSLMESGAAERIVRWFLAITGRDNSDVALLGSSYVLSIPVFFDNVFYLLAPLARSMRARTGGHMAAYVSALSAGALATHMLVPPTPGPLAMADEIGVDVGTVIMVGIVVAIPTSLVGGFVYARWIDKRMDITLKEAMGTTAEELEAVAEKPVESLPGLGESMLPILVAVGFVATSTIADVLGASGAVTTATTFIGDPNFALTAAALVAAYTFYRAADLSRDTFGDELTEALKSGGNIVAITAAGGAFGAMLGAAGVGEYFASNLQQAGISLLITSWLIAGLIRIAQGSGTVALLTTSALMAPLAGDLAVHPVYMIMAIGTGGMMFSWYNDSGFWIASEVAGITQTETLKTWSAVNSVMSVTGLVVVLVLSQLVPTL
ncbi:MAG: GntP family permease [Halanaeroarchaeum sp.]